MPDHYGGAKGVEDMLVVRMQQQSIINVACMCLVVPENPMTALISRSFCI